MKTIGLHPKSLGLEITVHNKLSTISKVLSNGKFRIADETEKEGSIVNDYSLDDVELAEKLIISVYESEE